jgi:hypothetical protein
VTLTYRDIIGVAVNRYVRAIRVKNVVIERGNLFTLNNLVRVLTLKQTENLLHDGLHAGVRITILNSVHGNLDVPIPFLHGRGNSQQSGTKLSVTITQLRSDNMSVWVPFQTVTQL